MPWRGIRRRVVAGFFEWVVPTVALMLLGTTTVVVWLQVGDQPSFAAVDVVLPTLLITLVVWQGVRMQQEDLSVERTGIVAAWFGLGMLTMFAFGLWGVFLNVIGQDQVPRGVQVMTQVAAGGLFGLLVGIYGVRARESAEEATQARLEQEFLERRQETNELLNRILRHHLLNSLTVIRGQTELLKTHVGEDGEQRVDTVVTRAERMADTIEDIRSITRTLTEPAQLVEMDVTGAIETEVETLREQYPDATIDVDLPTEATVEADDLLGRALRNVLHNAVEHNDADPRVAVTVSADDDAVTVAVADDGPGIPEDERETVLEASERGMESEGEGLGLFLTRSIVEKYGGSVTIAESDWGGARVELTLPRDAAVDPV